MVDRRSFTRRGVLRTGGVAGAVGLAGCATDRLSKLGGSGSPTADGPPDGESVDFDSETFSYPSLDAVVERHTWDGRGAVRLLETPAVEPALAAPTGAVSDLVGYVRETDFAESFVVLFDVSPPRSPYDLGVRDVVRASGRKVAVDAVRTGSGDDADRTTVVAAVRVPRGRVGTPAGALVTIEREQPVDGEHKWRELTTYPPSSETGLELLTRNEAGEYVAGDYPTELTAGREYEFGLVVYNHGSGDRTYTVVTQLHRVEEGGDRAVLDRETLDEFTADVAGGESAPYGRTVVPGLTGESMRLASMLFEGYPPDEPTMERAQASVHLWLSVVE